MFFSDLVEGDVFWYYVDCFGDSREKPTEYLCRGICLYTPINTDFSIPIAHYPGLTSFKKVNLSPGKNAENIPYLTNMVDYFFDSPSKAPKKIDCNKFLYGKTGVSVNRKVAEFEFNIFKTSIADGMNCSWCTTWYDMAVSNQSDGTLKCWACRNSNVLKRMLK